MLIEVLLLTTGFFLAIVLLILMIVFAHKKGSHKTDESVSRDIRRIKRQIHEE